MYMYREFFTNWSSIEGSFDIYCQALGEVREKEEKNMAMRKVSYGPERIMLSHILRMYYKESLLIYARELQLRRISGVKKDELAEKIANELLTPTVMKRRVATFTVEQRGLLERAIDRPFVPSEEEMEDALALHERDYAFLNKRDELNVPVDVAAAYKKLNTSDFRQYAKKMSWLVQCLFWQKIFMVFSIKKYC